jgi:hypothetical protein
LRFWLVPDFLAVVDELAVFFFLTAFFFLTGGFVVVAAAWLECFARGLAGFLVAALAGELRAP